MNSDLSGTRTTTTRPKMPFLGRTLCRGPTKNTLLLQVSNVSKMLQSRFRRLLVVLIVLVGWQLHILDRAPTPLIANASFPCNSDDLEQNNAMGWDDNSQIIK